MAFKLLSLPHGIAALVGPVLAAIAFATDAKGADIDAWYKPEGSIVDKPARYYVWYDEHGWHLRSCAKMTRHFQGTVRVENGKVKSCLPVGLKHDRGKGVDPWVVSADRSELTFAFTTSVKSDGLDIQIEGTDAKVEFDLHIEKEHGAKIIFIGKHEQHPPSNPFKMPAAPVAMKKEAAKK